MCATYRSHNPQSVAAIANQGTGISTHVLGVQHCGSTYVTHELQHVCCLVTSHILDIALHRHNGIEANAAEVGQHTGKDDKQ